MLSKEDKTKKLEKLANKRLAEFRTESFAFSFNR